MKVCLLTEGSYPYVVGGVSAWTQMLIEGLPDIEFSVYSIGAFAKDRGAFKYKFPKNFAGIQEVFLDEILAQQASGLQDRMLGAEERQALWALVSGEGDIDFARLIEIFHRRKWKSPLDIFMARDFFDIIRSVYREKFSYLPFTDFFWTMRSMLLPLFYLLQQEIPEADIYHSVATGYCGIIGGIAATLYHKPYIITEHGIYSREREAEIIKSEWAKGDFKSVWISYFYALARLSYSQADFLEMMVIWVQSVYLTAVKRFRRLIGGFAAGSLLSVATDWFLLASGMTPPHLAAMLAVTLGMGLLMTLFFLHIVSCFGMPRGGLPFGFLPYFERHWRLGVASLGYTLGLFVPNLIIWQGPWGVDVSATYRYAPAYDVVTFYAFISILPLMVLFVVAAETNFYTKYAAYFDAITRRGNLREIEDAQRDLLYTLWFELRQVVEFQFLFTLAALEQARGMAEQLEAEARAQVKAAEKWHAEAVAWRAEAEQNRQQAQEQVAVASKWQAEAEASLAQAEKDVDTVARGLWRFGVSRGIQFGALYDHTKGEERGAGQAVPHRGHQACFPVSFYQSERLDRYPGKTGVSDAAWPQGEARHWLEMGLTSGWLGSYQNGPQGTSAGLLDTALTVRYHNDHPIGTMSYGLTVSLPTGQHRSYDKARVPQGLAFFQDFGAGWQLVPEVEGGRRLTERDSIHAALSYEVRRSYDYRKEVWDDHVDPGDILRGRLSYRHIGDREQAEAWLKGSYTGRTVQDTNGLSGTYRDGPAVEIGWAYRGACGRKDAFETFMTYGHQRRTSAVWEARATDDNEIAIGLYHTVSPAVHWQVLASRFHSTTGYDTLYREADTGAWTRYSLLARVDWQASPTEAWTLGLERYRRREQGRVPYQGVAAALWYTHAF